MTDHGPSEKKLLKEVIKTAGLGINRYKLIGDGDRVLVGISGGKDSYVLLETLALRRRHIPIDYELHAVHVKVTGIPYEADRDFLESFCAGLSVPFTVITKEIEPLDTGKETPCFLCSWTRRKALFDYCAEKGFPKLALGHHRDDIIETFLLNIIFQGSVSTMPPGLDMFGGSLRIIRPLAMVAEERIMEYARIRGFPPQIKTCPYGDDTKRHAVKNIIGEMEKLNRDARNSLFRSLHNVRMEYLP
jgi:tRNA(Ile)-lysidine synthase TilS/MesJ